MSAMNAMPSPLSSTLYQRHHHRVRIESDKEETIQRVVYVPISPNLTTPLLFTSQPQDVHVSIPPYRQRIESFKPNPHDMISSHTVVQHQLHHYYILGTETKASQQDYPIVELAFPKQGVFESYPLLVPKRSEDYHPVSDLRESIVFIVKYCFPPSLSEVFGTYKQGILRRVVKACNRRNPDDLVLAVQEFNQTVMETREQKTKDGNDPPTGNPFEFVAHVLEQSYGRSVTPQSDQLKVKGFSNNVYGEVKQKLVDEFIQNTGLKPGQVFLDMGSGIGNVVLQVAAQCLCESFGIEIMDKTAAIANDFCKEFKSRMRSYDRPCGPIVLKQGDFLDDPEIDLIIKKADVIFVNNYIFDAHLNQQILHKFLDLKDDAKIISLRSFDKTDRKITARTSQSIGSILKGKQYFFARDSVSWMSEGGKYYIHTVDRSTLQQFESNSSLPLSESNSSN